MQQWSDPTVCTRCREEIGTHIQIRSRREGRGFVIEQDRVTWARFPCLPSEVDAIMALLYGHPEVRAAMEAAKRAAVE